MVTTRFPDLKLYLTYAEFAQALYTRLGIGAGGDGGKALRLLARIQGGQQIRTVDGLYKSLVLEEPATYAAADNAVSHFSDLDESYAAMVTEGDKAKLLERLPVLHDDYAQASETARMIDALGAQAGMDSPFTLWTLRTEALLIAEAIRVNRESRRAAAGRFGSARSAELSLEKQLTAIERQIRANGGDVLERLQEEIRDLGAKQEETRNRRARFDVRTERLAISPATAEDFNRCQIDAKVFLARFDDQVGEIDGKLAGIGKAAYPLAGQREELQAETRLPAGPCRTRAEAPPRRTTRDRPRCGLGTIPVALRRRAHRRRTRPRAVAQGGRGHPVLRGAGHAHRLQAPGEGQSAH